MCSAADDPTQYDKPVKARGAGPDGRFSLSEDHIEPTQPRAYRLSGDRPVEPEPQPSIALAVLGEMLTEAERMAEDLDRGRSYHSLDWADAQVAALREARDRIAKAERHYYRPVTTTAP
jgi:hypothetical protein